jgi:hypothetical protein
MAISQPSQCNHCAEGYAQIAQLVEQRIENPRVRGSNPRLGTTRFTRFIDRHFIPFTKIQTGERS